MNYLPNLTGNEKARERYHKEQMNLSDCKTIEEYREAAHYWQKRWADTQNSLDKAKQVLAIIDKNHVEILTLLTSIGLDRTTII